jgi:phage-related minor tail protein
MIKLSGMNKMMKPIIQWIDSFLGTMQNFLIVWIRVVQNSVPKMITISFVTNLETL